jgi:penicillin-binding protein 1A
MTFSRFVGRVLLALISFAVVGTGLLSVFGAVALAIEWDVPEPQEILGPSTVFDRDGQAIYRFRADIERRPVPFDAISPHLRNAVIATEDHRFFDHQGVDPFSVVRAVIRNVATGSINQGGSTLTQQYVKNVYVGNERSLYRKIREAVVSLQLEKEMTKEEILEAYLNRAYFGEGSYGAEAAALSYFGKPAAALTLGEAAVLASTLSAPSRFSPRNDPAGAVQRRDSVLQDMARYGLVAPEVAEYERSLPLNLAAIEVPKPAAPFLVEEARRQLEVAYGPELLYNGGLSITLSIDLDRQWALEREVIRNLPNPTYDIGLATVDPRSGDILAAWSGRDFAVSEVDLALGGGTIGRQTGSAFKPIVLATALEEGMSLDTSYPAPSSVRIADWNPTGGGCGGRCTLRQATASSVNTVFAQLGRDVGAADFATMGRRLGIRSPLAPDDVTQSLGTASVTPLDMASAFATFANDGVACPARLILEVRDPGGAVRADAPDPRQPSPEERAAWTARLVEQGYDLGPEDLGRCYRAVAPSVARQVTQALELAVADGTGRRAQIGRPQAGKTGTSQNSKDVWFTGYTPDFSAAVFLGAVAQEIPVRGLRGCRGACFGGDVAAPIWGNVATVLLAGVTPTEFPTEIVDERHAPLDQREDRRRLGGRVRRDPPPGTAATPRPRPQAPAPEPPAPLPSDAPTLEEPQPLPSPEFSVDPVAEPGSASEPPTPPPLEDPSPG